MKMWYKANKDPKRVLFVFFYGNHWLNKDMKMKYKRRKKLGLNRVMRLYHDVNKSHLIQIKI